MEFRLVLFRSDSRIGLAYRKQRAVVVTAAEGVIRIEGRAAATAALRVHQHAIGDERIALPFVPQAGAAARDTRRMAAIEHDALDRGVARAVAQRLSAPKSTAPITGEKPNRSAQRRAAAATRRPRPPSPRTPRTYIGRTAGK